MSQPITKNIEATYNSLQHLFKERYFNVTNEHKGIGGALAKCFHDEKGYQFEFTKMELASQDERNRFIDDTSSPIDFEDNFQKISFTPKGCSEFGMQIAFSGFTSVNGVIAEFTTESFQKHTTAFYRAVVPTNIDFANSQHFAIANRLHIKNTTYGSGILEFIANEIPLHTFSYSKRDSKEKFYIIETQAQCDYEEFVKTLDEILLAITYLTGHFLGREIYVLASEESDFKTSEVISLKQFFEDLRRGKNAVPDSDIFHHLRMPVELCKPLYFQELVTTLEKSLIFKRAVLLLCQAHTEPQYVRSSLYSVALETITGLITENIREKVNPVTDKSVAKSIICQLRKVLATFKTAIPAASYELFSEYIGRINSPTNKQKLLIPFKHFGILLPDKDAEAIGKRNDFLHGRMPELNSQDELIILNNRILFCIDCLILKYIGYKGFMMYHPALHQLHSKMKVEEYPIRKI